MANSEDSGIQIRIRPPRQSDQKAIQDMYQESITEGENSPLHVALESTWTEPLSLILYAVILLGLSAFIITDATRMKYGCLCAAISSVIGIFGYGRYMRWRFMEFLRNSFESDLGNIVAHYNIEENTGNVLNFAASKSPQSGFWVAEASGPGTPPWIVGSIALDMSTSLQSGTGELRRLAVSPHSQRKGVARKLITTLVAHARSQGVTHISLSTSHYQPAAVKLYKRMGWKVLRTHEEKFMLTTVLIFGLRLNVQEFKE